MAESFSRIFNPLLDLTRGSCSLLGRGKETGDPSFPLFLRIVCFWESAQSRRDLLPFFCCLSEATSKRSNRLRKLILSFITIQGKQKCYRLVSSLDCLSRCSRRNGASRTSRCTPPKSPCKARGMASLREVIFLQWMFQQTSL